MKGNRMQKIWCVVVTGGPGGGKSAVGCIRERLAAYGYYIIIMPEIATEFFMSGFTISKCGLTNYAFQREIIDEQLTREDRYKKRIAQVPGNKKLLIFERGTMDGKAYLENDIFLRMIHQMGYRTAQLRDERYDGIFHLESAAVGAREFYTTTNNPARKETPEEAAARDLKTRQAWVGHPHLRIIKSNTDFNQKMEQFSLSIERLLGIPEPLEIERKLLVAYPNLDELVHRFGAVPVIIEQIYLQKKKGIRERIRRRTQDGYSIFYLTHKRHISDGVNHEIEIRINEATYTNMRKYERDHSRNIIRKERYCFLWDGQYFELDIFQQPKKYNRLALMEIELESRDQHITLPPFIKIIEEVTNDPHFANASLAKK